MPIYRFINAGAVFAARLNSLADLRRRYTITGAPTIVDSPYGHAIRLDGTNDYITLTAEEEYNLRFDSGAQDFSIVIWLRRGVIGSAFEFIFEKQDAYQDGWTFYIQNDISRFRIQAKLATGPMITDNNWHCIAIVVDRSTDMRVCVDGVAGTPAALAGDAMATTILPVIGGPTSQADYRFNGDIYAVVVYDRILTVEEVLDLATNRSF